jgi:hypothetical protein
MTSSCISLLASFTNGVTSAKNGHFFTASMANGNKHEKKLCHNSLKKKFIVLIFIKISGTGSLIWQLLGAAFRQLVYHINVAHIYSIAVVVCNKQ